MESHATPCGGTPQQRYASLHRAIEKGLDSDDVWCELALVSKALGHHLESDRCAARVREVARRDALLARLGTPRPRRRADGRTDSDGAPAASHAGTDRGNEQDAPRDRPTVVEHLLDAVQYLMHQHMPWLVLTTMLAFPLLVGVGGVLTAGESPLLLLAIAALPGVCVLTVLAAMGSAILRRSSEGEGDVPNVPEFGLLVRDGRDFMVDSLMVLVLFFGAPVTMVALGAPMSTALPSFAIAVFVAPMAFALRHVRRDLQALSPVVMMQAIRRCGVGYAVIAVATSTAFAPAALVAVAVCTRPIWMQIAIVGPLSVLPVFCAARLLGTFLDTNRKELGSLMIGGLRPKREQEPAAAAAAAAQVTRPRELRKPEALNSFRAPRLTKATRPQRGRDVQPVSALGRKRRARPEPRAIEGRRPTSKGAPTRTKRKASDPATDRPDLGNMPGAVVVSGRERQRLGAASRRS